ncbi:ATP-binding protein [Acrocarpospora pleiomorpha]|uniref:ATP-binding protein n=1 Tax=Acrocarpospora pleiomorpha TaxID=90975 RepID=A0A5M3XDH1_9ACTN|nr:AAA family ATPase [Acrocarpospora pleiomorpha]GES18696.1 ATP-binding protein [Acrocarpospora pleiomorpha]
MYISSVRVENVKGFTGPRTVDLDLTRPDGSYAGWTVIAGRNGSGKTALLRAIALAVSGPYVARTLVSDFENWISHGEDQASVRVGLVVDDHDFWIGDYPPDELNVGIDWTMPASRDKFSGRRGLQPTLSGYPAESPETGPWDENSPGWFCAAYGPFRRLIGGSGDAQRLMLGPERVARMASLFHEDASLAEGVTWLIELHLRALEGRPGAQEVKDTAMMILSDGLLPDGYRIEDIDSDGLWVVHDGRRFPLREMSDGYRAVAALVTDLIRRIFESMDLWTDGDRPYVVLNPGVVIIDEIDAHLHVSWQQRLGGWLKAHFPNIQFIVTTHSPYICQDADEGGLIRLPGPNETEAPSIVPESLYKRIVHGSGDDAVLSELFGLDTPYSAATERLREELVTLEAAILEGHADEDAQQRYLELKRQLASSPATRADEVAARLGLTGPPER